MDGSDAVVDRPNMFIRFQHGNPEEVGLNGCSLEDVIEVLVQKLLDFQGRDLACIENAVALYHLTSAQEALVARASRREQQGVRGTKRAHLSPKMEPKAPDLSTFPSFEKASK